jgi:hypothetical protein
VGQYYLDTNANVLYGPKVAPAATDTVHMAYYTPRSGAFNLGVRFTVNTPGSIIGLDVYPTTVVAAGSWVLELWNVGTNTLLAQVSPTVLTTGQWQTVNFTSPVAVTTGVTYMASVWVPTASDGAAYNNALSVATTSPGGNITLLATGGYYGTASGTMPATSWGNNNGLVAPVWTAGGPTWPVAVYGVPKAGATAQALTKNSATDWDLAWTAAATIPPATTVTGPDAFGAASVVGTSTLYARQDHDHGLPANPAPGPATTVAGPPAYGAAPIVGTGTLYARNDHIHGLPAAPVVPGAATTVTGPDAFSTPSAVGTSTLYARQDHDHGLPANPAPTAATTVVGPAAYGDPSVVGSGTNYARNDHAHGLPAAPAVPAAATTVTGPAAFGTASAVGAATTYAREDHNHGNPANPAPSPATTVAGPPAYGAAPIVGTGTLYARNDHSHGLPAAAAGPPPATTVTGPDAFGAASAVGTSTAYARQDHDHGLPAAPGGVPSGGSQYQALTKTSGTDYATTWRTVTQGYGAGALAGAALPAGPYPVIVQGASSVVTTDANANAAIGFPVAFPNGLISVVVVNGDANAVSQGLPELISTTAGSFTFTMWGPPGNAIRNGTIRVNWIAFGW